MTPARQRLFEALAQNREFQEWLSEQEVATLKVLKQNITPSVLHQAQGTAQFIDSIRAVCEAAAKK